MTEKDRDETPQPHVESFGNMGTLSGFGGNEIAGEVDREPTDRRIREQICAVLEGNEQVPIERLDVAVERGVATLRGAVRDEHTRQRAADIVALIAGVNEVRNELTVAS